MQSPFNIKQGHETSNEDLDRWGKRNIPGYLGVIEKKDLYKLSYTPGSSWIVNMDDKKGTHWCAMRVSDQEPGVMYIDPFGFPPPNIIPDAAYEHGLNVYYSPKDHQILDSENCGQWSLHFLNNLAKSDDDWRTMAHIGGARS